MKTRKQIKVIDISKNSLSLEQLSQVKKELKEEFLSRIVKNVNDQGCWHLAPIFGSKPSSFIWHYSDNGIKRICFTVRRLAFEYFKHEISKGMSVYSNCHNQYCINPDHHYSSTIKSYINQQIKSGLRIPRS